MFGRSVVPQVASTSQPALAVQRSLQTCRHSRLSGPRGAVATPDPVLEEQKMPSADEDMPPNLNKYSQRITQPKSQGASQAMLYATGLTEEDMNKPQVALLQFLSTRDHKAGSAVTCLMTTICAPIRFATSTSLHTSGPSSSFKLPS